MRYDFGGNYGSVKGVYKRVYRFNSKWVSKKERVIQELEMHLRNHFVGVLK